MQSDFVMSFETFNLTQPRVGEIGNVIKIYNKQCLQATRYI